MAAKGTAVPALSCYMEVSRRSPMQKFSWLAAARVPPPWGPRRARSRRRPRSCGPGGRIGRGG
eukprot:90639-Chlamydomonas_euryale.AAC.1